MTRPDTSSAQELTPAQVVYQMLWSRRDAAKWLRVLGPDFFAGQVAYGPSVVAVIDDHDRTHPDAPATGNERVLSIVQHATTLARDVLEHPEQYTDAVQGMYARSSGSVDRMLLRHAAAVTRELARLAVVGDQDDTEEN